MYFINYNVSQNACFVSEGAIEEPDELDFETTLKLMKKRQALQKQLSLLEYEEQDNDQDSFTKARVIITKITKWMRYLLLEMWTKKNWL